MKLVAHNDGLDLRGNERQLALLVEGLVQRGHSAVVSSRPGGALRDVLRTSGIRTTDARPRGDLDLVNAWRFRSMVRSEAPDALLLTSWKRILTAGWAGRHAGVRRIAVRLGIVRPAPSRKVPEWRVRQTFLRYVDLLIVNSSDVRNTWLESAPWFPEERVHVVNNAVAPVRGDGTRLRAELRVDSTASLVTAVGALERRKGFDLVIRAIAQLPSNVHAVFAGAGPEEANLRQLAGDLGVTARTHFLGQRGDVPDILAASSAFVLPSRMDSLANSMLEAMSAGVPVVATSGNGVGDALAERDGRSAAGWITEPEDDTALAAGIGEAIQDGGVRAREGQWRAQHWFSVDTMVDAYERLLFA